MVPVHRNQVQSGRSNGVAVESAEWTVLEVDGRAKMDGSSKSARFKAQLRLICIEMDGPGRQCTVFESTLNLILSVN